MRKLMSAMLAGLLAVLLTSQAVMANEPYGASEYEYEQISTPAVIDFTIHRDVNGVTFVPVRTFAYLLGLEVDWNEAQSIVTLTSPEGSIAQIHMAWMPEEAAFIDDGITWVSYQILHMIWFQEAPLPLVEASRTDYWTLENFAEVREPSFSTDLTPGQIALGLVEFMNDNLYARTSFSYREKEAARWIVEELMAMGYGWDYIEVQEFAFIEVFYMETSWPTPPWNLVVSPWVAGDAEIRETTQLSQNVILTVPGQSERTIIVGAHYDSIRYPGASDNASGTALLLESAQRMLQMDNYHTIVYVFFGAEEVGLMGAYFYYDSLSQYERDNIIMMVNADVLFEGPYFIFGAGQAPNIEDFDEEEVLELFVVLLLDWGLEEADIEEFLPLFELEMMLPSLLNAGLIEPVMGPVTQQIEQIAIDVQQAHDIELISVPQWIFGPSDHLVFLNAGHNVVFFSGMDRAEDGFGHFIGEFIMRVWHTPMDDFHFIEENWPGKMYDALRTFSIFLEEILLARY